MTKHMKEEGGECKNCSRTGTIAVTANNTCPECGRQLDRPTPPNSEDKERRKFNDRLIKNMTKCSVNTTPPNAERSVTQEPRGVEGWEKEVTDFYWESGKYENRELGLQAWLSFISNLLAEQRKKAVERVIGKHNARILNHFQLQSTSDMPMIAYDERVCLIPAIKKATEETLATIHSHSKDEKLPINTP